jgi:hypothetical protein
LLLASAPSQSDANVPHDDVTLHKSLCVLHAQVPWSTAHFRAARVAASHDPFATPQKKKRSHLVLAQLSDAPLLHQASHSGDVATLRAGRMELTPPLLLHADAQNISAEPVRQLPAEQTVPIVIVSPSVQTHSCGLQSWAVVQAAGEAGSVACTSGSLLEEEPHAAAAARERKPRARSVCMMARP